MGCHLMCFYFLSNGDTIIIRSSISIHCRSYTDKLFVTYNTEPRELYLNCMSQGPLKQLAIRCLEDDHVKRPSILHVCERIDQMLQGKLCVFKGIRHADLKFHRYYISSIAASVSMDNGKQKQSNIEY